MAKFFPTTISDGAPNSERKLWRALESLDEEWRVFHSVAWQAPRGGREGDGEADFVLLHRRHGILVIEVKGGGIELVGGQWFTNDRFGERHTIKDPFRQAVDSKHALLKYLRQVPGLASPPSVSHAVAFPDVAVTESLGLNPRAVILDTGDLADTVRAVDRVLAHWRQRDSQRLSARGLEQLVRLLAPTLTMAAGLRGEIAHSEREIVTLTAQQIAAMSMLRNVRHCIIRGGAGTGKTLLAVEKVRRVAAEGGKALLVCFNAPLATKLAASLKDAKTVTVSTFHSLCTRLAGSRVPASADDTWFAERAATVLVDAAGDLSGDQKFDALVVDEAQDLSDEWLTALQYLLRHPDESPILLLLDTHQQLYRSALNLPAHWPVIELDRNCRNTLPIARQVASCFGDTIPTEGADGPVPSFIEADDGTIVDVVHDVVRRLLVDEGLAPEQVVVLSNHRKPVERLRSMLVGPAAFVEPGRSGVLTDTVHRFKGLESEIIVLAMSGRPGSLPDKNHDRTLAYVGTSRARSALLVVATRAWVHWFREPAAS